MSETNDRFGEKPDRRRFLRRLAGATAFAAAGVAARRAAAAPAADPALDALIGDGQHDEFGQTFDQASRTIHMPKPTAPTLSPQTAQITEDAVHTYDGIVARGGWPQVPQVDELHLGMRHPSVVDLRARLAVSGDLDPNAVGNDIYDSYVEAAVRRFQARHGLTTDGVVRQATLLAMNVPAATRRDQLKVNISRLKTLTTNLGPRYVVVNIPAARVEAIEHDVAVSRHTAVVGKPDRALARHQQQDHRDQLQSVLDRAGIDRAQGSDPAHAEGAGLSEQKSHPHLRSAAQGAGALADQLVLGRRGPLHVQAGSRQFQFAGPHPHQFPESLRRLYARHAAAKPVRRRFPLRFVGLRAACRTCASWCTGCSIETKGWPPEAIDQAIESGEQENARPSKPVPLHWVYVTAWSASDGIVQFREDIYNRDGLGGPAIPPMTKL